MGSGSKSDSALSTQGGRANVVTNMDIGCGEPLAKDILSEMEEEGTKFTKEKSFLRPDSKMEITFF